MKIIIPTLTKQIEKQITFADLNKIKEHIWFVTDKETAKHLCVLHNQIIILDKKDITYNDLLKYIITERYIGQTIWIVNDNLEFAKYSSFPNEKYLMQRKFKREPRLIKEFWNTLNLYAKRFANGGFFSAILPPLAGNWPGVKNSLYLNNFWLNLKEINLNDIDFKSPCRIDLLLFLHMLKNRTDNALIYEYGIHNNRDIILNTDTIAYIKKHYNDMVSINNDNKIYFNFEQTTITQNTFSDFFIETA